MKWPTIKIGDMALRKGGSIDPKKHPDEVFELYSIPAFDSGAPEIVIGSAIGSAKKIVQPNDVMISRIVPHIRRGCVVGPSNGHRQIASGEWIVFRSENIWPQFLRWVLVGNNFHAAFMRTVSGVGGSLLRARPVEVYKIQIPLPPLPEQKRIAEILDAADALRAKRRESLAQLDALLQSTFLDMFGDPVSNPMGWEIEPFEKWLENIDSGWSPKCLNRKATDSEWGVLKLGAVTKCEFDETQQKALPLEIAPRPNIEVSSGDLLFSRKNTHELVAAVAYVHNTRPKLMLPDLIFRLRLASTSKIEPRFLWQLLIHPRQRKSIQKLAGGAAGSMPNISKTKLRTVNLIKPPLDLQKKFATIVESIEHQKASQRAHLGELNTLFASLQQRAFNGEL